MVDDIKFSIIIPVYNVQDYLEDCLNSIINQSYSNFEIICVNDGSFDTSLSILQEYAKKDLRIKILDQENKGTGIARNNGMKLATGDYISFIDPDDWFELDTFENLNNFLKKKHSEVVEFSYKMYYEASQTYEYDKYEKDLKKNCDINLVERDSYTWKDLNNILLYYKSSCWKKVYLRNFILDNKIEFSPHKQGEDIPFAIDVLFNAKRIDLLNEPFYVYRRRPNSATTSTGSLDMFYVCELIDFTKGIIIKNKLDKLLKNDFNEYQFQTFYDADKKCDKKYRKIINEKAKEYLPLKYYLKFCIKKNFNRLIRNIFSYKKHYKGTKNILITILGFKFQIKGNV